MDRVISSPFSDVSDEAWADAWDDALGGLPEGVEPTHEQVLAALDARAESAREEDCFDARNDRRTA